MGFFKSKIEKYKEIERLEEQNSYNSIRRNRQLNHIEERNVLDEHCELFTDAGEEFCGSKTSKILLKPINNKISYALEGQKKFIKISNIIISILVIILLILIIL